MATTVGLVHMELRIAEAASLKDKRRAIRSFKDRLRNTWNVSVAEVDRLDNRQLAVLAVAMVSKDRRYLEGALQKLVNATAAEREISLVDYELELL